MRVRIEVETRQELPQTAYDATRQQYNAAILLEGILKKITIGTATERVIVVVDVDLFIPGVDFVYGFSDAKKGIGVISVKRLKDTSGDHKPDDGLFYDRAVKVAVAEIGHSLGLAICSQPRCVMNPAGSQSEIDKKKNTYCIDCRKKLRLRYSGCMFTLPTF